MKTFIDIDRRDSSIGLTLAAKISCLAGDCDTVAKLLTENYTLQRGGHMALLTLFTTIPDIVRILRYCESNLIPLEIKTTTLPGSDRFHSIRYRCLVSEDLSQMTCQTIDLPRPPTLYELAHIEKFRHYREKVEVAYTNQADSVDWLKEISKIKVLRVEKLIY